MWHGFSWKFHVILCMSQMTTVSSKLTPNSMIIPCHLSRFYLFYMLDHDMDFGQFQVMEFLWHLLRKWWNFNLIWCHFQPNCRQKDVRKSVLHFLRGLLIFGISQILILSDLTYFNFEDSNCKNFQNCHFSEIWSSILTFSVFPTSSNILIFPTLLKFPSSFPRHNFLGYLI